MSKLDLKNPYLVGVLSFLLPGLGHAYQKRYFKAVLNAVCILGLFAVGQQLGDGKVVYFNWRNPEQRTYAYVCQFWVGLPALPGLGQIYLRSAEDQQPNNITGRIQSRFTGTLSRPGSEVEPLTGEVLIMIQNGIIQGEVTGLWKTGGKEYRLAGQLTNIRIDPRVGADQFRWWSGSLQAKVEEYEGEVVAGFLVGSVERGWFDRYGAPLSDDKGFAGNQDQSELERVHERLGARFELGVVFTMIAGLLNLLAIYDAIDGPAYAQDEETPAPAPPAPAV